MVPRRFARVRAGGRGRPRPGTLYPGVLTSAWPRPRPGVPTPAPPRPRAPRPPARGATMSPWPLSLPGWRPWMCCTDSTTCRTRG